MHAHSASETGKIIGYIPYTLGSEEMFFIKLDKNDNAEQCNTYGRFTMTSSNPRFKSTQAAVLAAFMAKTEVTVRGLGSCNNSQGSEDMNYICLGVIPC